MNEKTKKKIGNNGFVLFFSLIISSIVLSIISGIILIAYKELIISSTGRESQKAFYSADAGTECALYWDVKHPLPGYENNSVFPSSNTPISPMPLTIPTACGGQDITINFSTNPSDPPPSATAATSTFTLNIFSSGVCATVVDVVVSKYVDELLNEKTKIDSHGYNTCDPTNPRRVERGIRITY